MLRGRLTCWCCLLGLILGGVTAGEATDWAMVLDLETKGQYSSNINYSARNRQSDYILSAQPRAAFQYNSEITRLEGSLALLGLHYLSNSSLDRINQYYRLGGTHQLTPRFGLRLGLNYSSDSTLQEELTTSGVFINRSLRTALGLSPGVSVALTERLSTFIDYGFNYTDYQSRQYYSNYRTHSLSNGFDYILNEKTVLRSFITASYIKYNTDNTISSLGAQLGFNHKFTENLDLSLMAGATFQRIKSNISVLAFDSETGFIVIVTVPQKSTSLSPFITLASSYRWATGSFSLSYSRSQSASAYGALSQFNSFGANVNQRLTEKLNFSISPSVYISTLDSRGSDYTSIYYGIRPGLAYNFTERLRMGLSYAFNYRKVTGASNYAFPTHEAYVTLNYTYPIHYQQ